MATAIEPEEVVNQACRTLNLPRGASQAKLRRAYLKLSLLRHPDKPTGSDAKFKELQEAYNTLLSSPLAKLERELDEQDAAMMDDIQNAQAQLAQLEAQRHEREDHERRLAKLRDDDARQREIRRRNEERYTSRQIYYTYAQKKSPAVLFLDEYYHARRDNKYPPDAVNVPDMWVREDGMATIHWSTTRALWLLRRPGEPFWYELPHCPHPFNSHGKGRGMCKWATWYICHRNRFPRPSHHVSRAVGKKELRDRREKAEALKAQKETEARKAEERRKLEALRKQKANDAVEAEERRVKIQELLRQQAKEERQRQQERQLEYQDEQWQEQLRRAAEDRAEDLKRLHARQVSSFDARTREKMRSAIDERKALRAKRTQRDAAHRARGAQRAGAAAAASSASSSTAGTSAGASAVASAAPELAVGLEGMSTRQLLAWMDLHCVGRAGCIEKAELLQRCRDHLASQQPPPQPPPQPQQQPPPQPTPKQPKPQMHPQQRKRKVILLDDDDVAKVVVVLTGRTAPMPMAPAAPAPVHVPVPVPVPAPAPAPATAPMPATAKAVGKRPAKVVEATPDSSDDEVPLSHLAQPTQAAIRAAMHSATEPPMASTSAKPVKKRAKQAKQVRPSDVESEAAPEVRDEGKRHLAAPSHGAVLGGHALQVRPWAAWTHLSLVELFSDEAWRLGDFAKKIEKASGAEKVKDLLELVEAGEKGVQQVVSEAGLSSEEASRFLALLEEMVRSSKAGDYDAAATATAAAAAAAAAAAVAAAAAEVPTIKQEVKDEALPVWPDGAVEKEEEVEEGVWPQRPREKRKQQSEEDAVVPVKPEGCVVVKTEAAEPAAFAAAAGRRSSRRAGAAAGGYAPGAYVVKAFEMKGKTIDYVGRVVERNEYGSYLVEFADGETRTVAARGLRPSPDNPE